MAQAAQVETELASDAPNQGVLRATLSAIGNVCEGAAANLTAMGIAAGIRVLMGG
jgi:hypothetical protein